MGESRASASWKIQEGMSQADQAAIARSKAAPDSYHLGADSLPQAGVPRGSLHPFHWVSTKIYPGTQRDYWLYVPQQYDGSTPACLMIFQDGALYLSPQVNVTTVFDNLIHKGEIPITLGLFVNAGDRGPGLPIWGGMDNRSVEYDLLSDLYARFLIEELIPEVEQQYKIVADPAGRAICGISSGGICAFTAAWERPDAFGKVVSHVGSFTDIRGGHSYPSLIRKTEKKPIRVFLQDGSNDLDVVFGNWPLANQAMASALQFGGYDYQFVFGDGGHDLKHGAALFPDTMRWLWRDFRAAETTSPRDDT